MERNEYTQDVLSDLPRAELRRILVEELQKDTECVDDTLVHMLLVELRGRGSNPAFVDDDAVEAACKKFRQDMETVRTPRKRWYQRRLVKAASFVLVLGILFFALPSVTKAGKVQNVLGWWSDSVFQFIRPGQKPNIEEYVFKTDHPGLQEIYNTVTGLGITQPIVPRKLSKTYELTELKTDQIFENKFVCARLASEDHVILFSVVLQSGQISLQHEKTTENVSVWDLSSIEHYVISNTKELIVTWVVDNIECTVTTDCPKEDVYRLIKSIYTSED